MSLFQGQSSSEWRAQVLFAVWTIDSNQEVTWIGSAEAVAALLVLYCTWSDSCFWWDHYLFVLWQPPWSLSSLHPVPWQSTTAAVAVSDFLMLGFSKSKLVTFVIHKPPCSLASYSTFQCQIVSCNKCCGFCVSEHSIFLISKLFDAHFPSCSNLLLVHMWSPIVPNLIFWNFISLLIRLINLKVKCGPQSPISLSCLEVS